jgi:hypothetical protein
MLPSSAGSVKSGAALPTAGTASGSETGFFAINHSPEPDPG